MIEFLTGMPTVVLPAKVIINVGGVGYGLETTTDVLATLSEAPDQEVSLWVHTHVREDAFKLFGFASYSQKRLFEILISVSGVGPKLALAVLSTLNPALIADAAQSEESKLFEQVPGVGARLAKKLVVELKPKLQKEAQLGLESIPVAPKAPVSTKTSAAVTSNKSEKKAGPAKMANDLMTALENMGYAAKDVSDAISSLDLSKEQPIEELLRQAFQLIGAQNPGTKTYNRNNIDTLPF